MTRVFPMLLMHLPLAALLLAVGGCAETDQGSYAFHLEDGVLHRGSSPFHLRAVEQVALGSPGLDSTTVVKRLNSVCAAGGNSVVVSLDRERVPNGSLDSGWVQSFLDLNEEARKRSMGTVLRVELTGIVEQEALIEQLANALSGSLDVIVWLAGSRAGELTDRFRSRNPYLLTAVASGDSALVAGEPGSSCPIALYPEILPEGNGHFVLQDGSKAFDLLDERYGDVSWEFTRPPDWEGFYTLFDGTNLDAWVITGDADAWGIEGDAIVWKRRGGGRIRTKERFSDFSLSLEWRIDEGGNSGVFIRAPAAGRESRIGMEIQLFGDYGEAPHANGSGSIYDVLAPRVNASRPGSEWNLLELTCQGSRFQASLNGTTIHDVDLDQYSELSPRLREGFIALQDHGSPVAFRNIRIKPL